MHGQDADGYVRACVRTRPEAGAPACRALKRIGTVCRAIAQTVSRAVQYASLIAACASEADRHRVLLQRDHGDPPAAVRYIGRMPACCAILPKRSTHSA